MEKAQVSVVIATRNRSQAIARAVQNVLAEQPTGHLGEVIIVDNASAGEESRHYQEVIAALGAGALVRYVREDRPGATCARNRGVSVARFEYVAFIDDDVLVRPGWLPALLSCFEMDGVTVGAVGGKIELRPEAPLPPWLPSSFYWLLGACDHGDERVILDAEASLGAGNLVVRRTLYQEIGGFSERMSIYNEEVEFLDRMRGLGWSAVYTPLAAVDHVIPDMRKSRRALWKRSFRQGVGVTRCNPRPNARTFGRAVVGLFKAAGRRLVTPDFKYEFGVMYYLGALKAHWARD